MFGISAAPRYTTISATTTSAILLEGGAAVYVLGMVLNPAGGARATIYQRDGATKLFTLLTYNVAGLSVPAQLETPFLADKGLSVIFSTISAGTTLTIFYTNAGT